MKLRKIIAITTFLISIFSLMVSVKANTGTTEISGTINYDYINEVLELTNEERIKNNLDPLILDEELTKRANQRAYEIVYSFSHTRPNNQEWFTIMEDLDDSALGENIAAGYIDPSDVMDGWMNSEHHRNNIIGNTEASILFTTIGIGHVEVNGRDYWVQLFGNKLNNKLYQTGSIESIKTIEVTIPEEKIDYKEILVNPNDTDIILDKTESYNFFIKNKPIITINGFDILLNTDDLIIESSNKNIVDVNSYSIKSVNGNSGKTDITLKYNNEIFIYHVSIIGEDKVIINEYPVKNVYLSNNLLLPINQNTIKRKREN